MIFLIILPLLFTAILGNSTNEYIYANIALPDGRIIGGHPVDIEDYPYQVSVQILSCHYCGGAIISDRYILSAAHCYSGWKALLPYTVRAGSRYRYEGGQVVSVMKISTHPNYNKTAPTDSDISILRIAPSLTFGSGVAPISLAEQNQAFADGTWAAPISLPEQNQAFADGTWAVVSGWGYVNEDGSILNQLQAVWVPIVDNTRCESLYKVLNQKVTKSMVCAGYINGGKDACKGDSGGPLVANGLLFGIVSWGVGCAAPRAPGVTIFRVILVVLW
ncbi:Trypsin [Popillia japonica]|uniref:Trypsin n=1 Tax=Popillia japonica TaxID=7064 RepID=A0AAW1IW50_POPJA